MLYALGPYSPVWFYSGPSAPLVCTCVLSLCTYTSQLLQPLFEFSIPFAYSNLCLSSQFILLS
jgi:hypothetical protein